MAAQDPVQVASKDAVSYDKARSGYKPKTVQMFLDKLGILTLEGDLPLNNTKLEPLNILELAAGSGQFTKAISVVIKDTNVRLIASEPTEAMSNVLQENNPSVEHINCRSEKIRK
jgi:ubiquinone/menaquinone biosynthesis C-methylase UbiE